ncbi:MAG: mechanosensitive ion channel family protein [Treponema sp.]|nr:mechanosensitive ion channel family protein [Treponema sp.]
MEETIEQTLQPASETFGSAISEAGGQIVKQTSSLFTWIKGYFTWGNLFKVLGALVVVLAVWIIYKIILRALKRVPEEKVSLQRQLIIQKLIKYLLYFLVAMYILGLFGIELSAIWGAAGIAGVAIGFAAQTSVSNIISGIFVITEGALKIGDTIIVDGVTGIIDSINLLSIRVHTFDNQMVRIPNSTVINSNLINNSYHKMRRLTVSVDVAYDTDLEMALETLKKVPSLCPTVLADPAPNAWFDGFGDSGIHMTLAVWFEPVNFIDTKNAVYIGIKKVFDEAKIEIPFNQIDVNFDDGKTPLAAPKATTKVTTKSKTKAAAK